MKSKIYFLFLAAVSRLCKLCNEQDGGPSLQAAIIMINGDDLDLHGWHEFTSRKSEEPFPSIETLSQRRWKTDYAEHNLSFVIYILLYIIILFMYIICRDILGQRQWKTDYAEHKLNFFAGRLCQDCPTIFTWLKGLRCRG